MSKEEEKSRFYDNIKAQKIDGQKGSSGLDSKVSAKMEAALAIHPPVELENYSLYQSRFKKCRGNIQPHEAQKCLCLLKAISGIEGKKSMLSKISQMSTSLLLGRRRKEKKEINVCGPKVSTMDFSLDSDAVENPDPLLKILHAHCTNIDTIILNSCNVDKEGMESLAKLPKLKALSLSFCDHLTDDLIKDLGNITQLRELKLSWNRKLPLKALSSLSSLKDLELLDISHTNITDEVLDYIGRLENLTTLNLDDCGSITEKGVDKLKSLKKLHTINLSSCSVTDDGIKKIIELFPDLMSVTIRNNYFSDSGASELSNLKELTHLDLSWSHNFGGSFLDKLATLPKLRLLNLSRSGHLDMSKIQWKNFKNLMYMNLSYTNADDETLRQISFMPMFCGGSFGNCKNISTEGVKHFSGIDNIHYLDFTNCGLSYEELAPLFPPGVDIRV